jgi:hypothetical protein
MVKPPRLDRRKLELSESVSLNHHKHNLQKFNRAWENFDGIATALTDSLAEYIGGPIFIIAVAPVGNDNGEINVRM